MTQYVCQWWDFNQEYHFDYTIHESLKNCQNLALQGCIGYAQFKQLDNSVEYYAPIYVDNILVYDNNKLSGMYSRCDIDGWRWYEAKTHWMDMYSSIMLFPPKIN